MAEAAWEAVDRSDLLKAEKTLRNVLKTRVGDCVLWNDLGLVLWRKGDLREAERALRTAIMLRPNYEDGKMNLSALLASRGFYRQALRLEEEMARSSSRSEFHHKMAEEYRRLAETQSTAPNASSETGKGASAQDR